MSLWNVSLAEALRRIDRAQEERQIVFVANELDKLNVTRHLYRKNALEAVYEVCGIYPIRITERGRAIFVEYIPQEKPRFIGVQPDTLTLIPEVRYLDDVVVTCQRLNYDARGYTIGILAEGMLTVEALTFLPFVTRDGDRLKVNGQEVEQIFIDGMPITSLTELDGLESDLIDEVRVEYQPCQLHIRLRRPQHGGYYGALAAGTTYRSASGWGERQGDAVWYARFGRLGLYDKLDLSDCNTEHEVAHSSTSPTMKRNVDDSQQLHTLAASNRLSAIYEAGERQNIALSYYLAAHRGKASSVMSQPDQRTYYFDGQNKHIDQELTLRYDLKWGKPSGEAEPGGRLEVLFDIYDRWTKSENVSLYGAGVGTEQGESPSITMYRLKAEASQSLGGHYTLRMTGDMRWLGSLYDPESYVSNFLGSPTRPYLLNRVGEIVWLDASLHSVGMMYHLGMDAEAVWPWMRASAGVAWRDNRQAYHFGQQTEAGETVLHTGQLCPHLRVEIPLGSTSLTGAGGSSQLSLFWQQRLDEIPYAAQSPAMRWNDAFNFSIGNIDLVAPTVSTLGASLSLWKGMLNLTVAHHTLQNDIYWQTNVAHGQTDVFFTRPINLSQAKMWMLQGELNLHPLPDWRTKLSVQLDERSDDALLTELQHSFDNFLNNTQVMMHKVGQQHLHQRYTMDHSWRFFTHWNLLLHAHYEPTYRILDRTYHATYLLSGELQHRTWHNRLLMALTFIAAGRNRHLDRQLNTTLISDQWRTPLQAVGLRVNWNFSGGRHVNVNSVEGGQRYEELQEP